MKNKNYSQSAFSLIELLVVVAIIGILASVGVISYSGYVSSTKMKSAENIMQQIALAQTEYYSDMGTYFTQGNNCAADQTTTDAIIAALLVPISDELDYHFCTETFNTTNYQIKTLANNNSSKKGCEITVNNVTNKAARNSSC